MQTIEQAKRDIRQGWKTPNGAICPCCDQKVKLYERKLMWMMARGLVALYWLDRTSNDGPYHHRNVIMPNDTSGSFAKLEYWRLIDQKVNTDTGKRCSGFWRITQKGIDFVENKISVPKYQYTYNMKVFPPELVAPGVPVKYIGIREALTERFNYQELMGYLL